MTFVLSCIVVLRSLQTGGTEALLIVIGMNSSNNAPETGREGVVIKLEVCERQGTQRDIIDGHSSQWEVWVVASGKLYVPFHVRQDNASRTCCDPTSAIQTTKPRVWIQLLPRISATLLRETSNMIPTNPIRPRTR